MRGELATGAPDARTVPVASGWRERLARAARSPFAPALAVAFVFDVVGLGWGLPASDGWDNDGVAPRDFLVAVSQTFAKQGFDFAYLHLAPVHSVLLALLTLPITLAGLVAAPSTAPADVVAELIKVPYMTAIAWVARAVTVAMALGNVWALGRIGALVRGPRAGALVAAAAACNAVLVYYAHTTALEVPSLFWGTLALSVLASAITSREPRRLRRFALLGALAIGTKDQAAGLFLLGAPLSILVWPVFSPWARVHLREIAREALAALGIAAAVFLVADEVIVNPTGFAARVRFLLGPASGDHAEYPASLAGRFALLHDIGAGVPAFFPKFFVPLAAFGLWAVLWPPGAARADVDAARAEGDRRAAALVPLWAALSFTVCVSFTALRSEHRFILPHMEMLGFYAGLGMDALLVAGATVRLPPAFRRWSALPLAALVAACLGLAALNAGRIDAELVNDPRYEAEAFLRSHVGEGDTIETYGLNVYLPRFPPWARVARVAPEAGAGRAPIPGLTEVVDRYERLPQRNPRWIVVCRAWAWHYLETRGPDPEDATRMVPRAQARQADDPDAARFFRGLVEGRLGYRLVATAAYESRFWAPIEIHSSTAQTVWIFEREG